MSGCSWLKILLPFLPCSCLCKQKTKQKNEAEIKPVDSVSILEIPANETIDKDLMKVKKNNVLEKQYDKNGIQPLEEKTRNVVKDNDRKCSDISIKGTKSIIVDLKNVCSETIVERKILGMCINLLIFSLAFIKMFGKLCLLILNLKVIYISSL